MEFRSLYSTRGLLYKQTTNTQRQETVLTLILIAQIYKFKGITMGLAIHVTVNLVDSGYSLRVV